MNPVLDVWQFSELIMPDVWYKDNEIYSLLQPFKRPRHIDPTAYDFKINFWANLIMKYCKNYHVFVVCEPNLQNIFKKDFKTTGTSQNLMCTSTILSFLETEGRIRNITEISYDSHLLKRAFYGTTWLISTPIKWSFNKIYSFYSDNDNNFENNKNSIFYIPEVLDYCINEFISWLNIHEHLFITHHLKVILKVDYDKLLASYSPDERSRDLLESMILKNGFIEIVALQTDNEKINVVRLCCSISKALNQSEKAMLAGLVSLQTQLRRVSDRYDLLEKRLNQIKLLAKKALNAGRKEEAKKQFLLGKRVEKELERARGVMGNLESLILDVEGARENGEVMRGMHGAATALKAQNIGLENARETVEELEDALAELDEFNTSIGSIGDRMNQSQLDTCDLEDELQKLLLNDDAMSGDIRNTSVPSGLPLPDVPIHDPMDDIRKTTPNNQKTKEEWIL